MTLGVLVNGVPTVFPATRKMRLVDSTGKVEWLTKEDAEQQVARFPTLGRFVYQVPPGKRVLSWKPHGEAVAGAGGWVMQPDQMEDEPLPVLKRYQFEIFLEDDTNRTGMSSPIPAMLDTIKAFVQAARNSNNFAQKKQAIRAQSLDEYTWDRASAVARQVRNAGGSAPNMDDPAVVDELKARWVSASMD